MSTIDRSEMGRGRPDADIASEACAWIAQLESGALTPQDLSAFREWVGRSPRHAAEIRRIARLAEDVNLLAGMAEPLSEAIDVYRPLLAAERRRHRQRWLAAAAVVVLAIGAVLMSTVMRNAPPMLLTTAMGEYRTVELADGSEVKLNSNSQLEVHYTRDMRRVRLLKGEVYFTVAHDASAPFVVFAQEKYVRAVGTEFAVRMTGRDLEVLVTSGVVEVNEAAASSRQTGSASPMTATPSSMAPMMLRAGQGVTVSLEQDLRPAVPETIVVHSEREIQRTLAWREGLLDFSRTPLKDVVAEVSRHTALQIEIADPALGELKFDGMFRVGQVDQLLQALGDTFNVNVERIDANHVRLSSK